MKNVSPNRSDTFNFKRLRRLGDQELHEFLCDSLSDYRDQVNAYRNMYAKNNIVKNTASKETVFLNENAFCLYQYIENLNEEYLELAFPLFLSKEQKKRIKVLSAEIDFGRYTFMALWSDAYTILLS